MKASMKASVRVLLTATALAALSTIGLTTGARAGVPNDERVTQQADAPKQAQPSPPHRGFGPQVDTAEQTSDAGALDRHSQPAPTPKPAPSPATPTRQGLSGGVVALAVALLAVLTVAAALLLARRRPRPQLTG
jgi:hypothetical protein